MRCQKCNRSLPKSEFTMQFKRRGIESLADLCNDCREKVRQYRQDPRKRHDLGEHEDSETAWYLNRLLAWPVPERAGDSV